MNTKQNKIAVTVLFCHSKKTFMSTFLHINSCSLNILKIIVNIIRKTTKKTKLLSLLSDSRQFR